MDDPANAWLDRVEKYDREEQTYTGAPTPEDEGYGKDDKTTKDFNPNQPRSAPGEISVHGGEFASEGRIVAGPDYEVGGAKYEEGRRLSSNYIHSEAPEHKPNSRKVPDIAKELNDRAQEILKQEVGVSEITRENATPKLEDYIAKTLAMELKDGLRNGHASNTWYSDKMQRTMQVAEKLHPEISTDQGKRFALTVALSIASQGERVSRAGMIADEAYTRFNKDGKFPTDIKVADPSITGNFEKMNKLIDRFGLEGTKKIFDTEYTNRDLQKATGYKVGKTNMDDKVYGSAVLGPKIGQGFYQNLSGNFKPLTMDMWYMRSWGRLTGTGIGHTDMDEQREKLRTQLKREGKAAPTNMSKLYSIAQRIAAAHEEDYKETRRLKTPLEHAAERFVYNYGGSMVEAPKGGNDRVWITSVFDKALDHLAKEGIHLTRAAAQATWWTPEQGLYKRLGARVPQYDTDYAKVFEQIAKKQGVTVDVAMKLQFAPWIDDPDPPDDMTEAEMDHMVEGFALLQRLGLGDFDPSEPRDPQGKWTAGGFGKGASMPPRMQRLIPSISHAEASPGSTFAFHGTVSSAVKSIMREGIKPGGGKGGDYWAYEHAGNIGLTREQIRRVFSKGDRPRSVFVTKSPDQAKEYAGYAEEANPGARAIVLAVDIPRDAAKKLKEDEQGRLDRLDMRFPGTIKPEWIAGVMEDRHVVPLKKWAEQHATDADTVRCYAIVLIPGGKEVQDFDPDQLRVPKGSGEESGRWTAASGGGGFEFVSPNIEHTGFEGALRGLTGDRQRALRLAATEIDTALGLDSVHTNIVGAWSDGAENSVLSEIENPDWDKLKLSGAMKGFLADQKSVLLFKQDDKGKAVLYKWALPGTLESAHNALMQAGIENHTLQKQERGVAAYVVDLDGSLHDKIAHASAGTDVEYQFGRAEFIGTTKDDGTDRQQRDDARRAYAKIIEQSPVQNGSEVWDRVHNRWGEALNPASGKIVQVGHNPPFEVMINPSERDLKSFASEKHVSDEFAGVRVLVDRNDNLFAWNVNAAIHASVARALDLDSKHEDIWFVRGGRLVSQRFGPYYGDDKKVIQQRLQKGSAEVRSWLQRAPAIMALNKVLKDALYDEEVGHPFHGNQYTGGISSVGTAVAWGEPTEASDEVDKLRAEMERNANSTVRDFTISQHQALDTYLYSGAVMNEDARKGYDTTEGKALDSAIMKFMTPREMTVFRHIGWHNLNEKLKAHVGKDFTEPGFMSTTIDPEGIIFKRGSYVEIRVPAGAHALAVGSLSPHPEEAEVLFPRNSRMRVISAEPLKAPNTYKFVAELKP